MTKRILIAVLLMPLWGHAMPMGHIDYAEREKVLLGPSHDASGVRVDVQTVLRQRYPDPVIQKRAYLLSQAFTEIILNRKGVNPYQVCTYIGMSQPALVRSVGNTVLNNDTRRREYRRFVNDHRDKCQHLPRW